MLVSHCEEDSGRYSTRETHLRLVAQEMVMPIADGAWRNGPWVMARAALAGMVWAAAWGGLCARPVVQAARAIPAARAHAPGILARAKERLTARLAASA